MDIKLLLQIAGVLLGLLYLWLEYRADIRLWIVGLVMPLIHGALYYKSGLYADCSMQAYYVLAGLYGWLVWRRRGRKTDAGLTGPEAVSYTHLDVYKRQGNAYTEAVREAIAGERAEMLVIAAATEADIAELEDFDERQMFLEDLGLEESGVARLIKSAYKLLNLETFFTTGADETRAWTYLLSLIHI